MIQIILDQLKVYKIIGERANQGDPIAGVLKGLIISSSGDANEFLGFTRKNFPSFTGHDLQHSWRIIKRVEDVLSKDALENLSSIEIFSLIIAAAFHDVGMISNIEDTDLLRRSHHIKSDEFLNEYLPQRLTSISEYMPRLAKCIGFIARAHGMSWEDMSTNEYFLRTERILEQPLRTNILAILLRIGDLLDMDSDRSCDPLRKFAGGYFSNEHSNFHHERHKNVDHFDYDNEKIDIIVIAKSKEEHTIWAEWFGYLKQDILHANTYIFKGSLSIFQLPKFSYEIKPASNANYELWTLRFEIDEKGRIWDVISQSVYTGKFDFLRELIQNSIDASLKWIYLNKNGVVTSCNPKKWRLADFNPGVIISYSEKKRTLEVVDNGIGMDKSTLKEFLFNVANSGFKKSVPFRDIPFPSIAKFGIGFVSCLVRADKITIQTRSRENIIDSGRKVVLKTEALDAYIETSKCDFGTRVKLLLNRKYDIEEFKEYIGNTYYSPAVPILIYDYDKLVDLIDFIKDRSPEFEPPLIESYSTISDLRTSFKSLISLQDKLAPSNRFRDLFLQIDSNLKISDNYINEQLFLYLDDYFDIKAIATEHTERMKQCDISIALIPVEIYDDELGIEWFSIHGFIIRRKKHEKRLFQHSISDRITRKEIIMILNEEEWDEENREYNGKKRELEEEEDEDDISYSDLYRKKVKKDPEDEYLDELYLTKQMPFNKTMFCESSNGMVFSDAEDNREYADPNSYKYSLLVNSLFRGSKKYQSKNMEEVTEEENLLSNLDTVLDETLNGEVFQDGVKLPIQASEIAPIGACYAKANLFGNARFELNVTRNAINESHVLLSNWMGTTGRRIQKKIVEKIFSVFESNKIRYYSSSLLTPKDPQKTSSVYVYSIEMLNSILKLTDNKENAFKRN